MGEAHRQATRRSVARSAKAEGGRRTRVRRAVANVDWWEVRTNVAEETAGRFDTVKEAAGGRFERSRLFLSEVRNELKRVTWPSQKEVYATTVVVILTSAFFGLYLFALDAILLKAYEWVLHTFGAA